MSPIKILFYPIFFFQFSVPFHFVLIHLDYKHYFFNKIKLVLSATFIKNEPNDPVPPVMSNVLFLGSFSEFVFNINYS